MADAFKPGQRVRHTSKTGPIMAIVEYGEFGIVGDEHKALCKWFDEKTRKFEQDTFFDHELEALPEHSASERMIPGVPRGPQSWMS